MHRNDVVTAIGPACRSEEELFCHPGDTEFQTRHGHPSEWTGEEIGYLLDGLAWLYRHEDNDEIGYAVALGGLQMVRAADELGDGLSAQNLGEIVNGMWFAVGYLLRLYGRSLDERSRNSLVAIYNATVWASVPEFGAHYTGPTGTEQAFIGLGYAPTA